MFALLFCFQGSKVEGRGGGSFWEVLAFGVQAHPSTTHDARKAAGKEVNSWPLDNLLHRRAVGYNGPTLDRNDLWMT